MNKNIWAQNNNFTQIATKLGKFGYGFVPEVLLEDESINQILIAICLLPNYVFHPSDLGITLKLGFLSTCYHIHRVNKTVILTSSIRKAGVRCDFFDNLLESVEQNKIHFEFKLFLLLEYIQMLSSADTIRLINYFHQILVLDTTPGVNKNNIILCAYNPIKVCALLYELIQKLNLKIDGFKSKVRLVQEELKSTMLKLIQKESSQFKLTLIFKDADFRGRPTFNLIVDLSIPELFCRLEGFIQDLWKGEYNLQGSIFDQLMITKLIQVPISTSTDIESKNRFYNITQSVNKQANLHSFLLKVWKRSIFVKFFNYFIINLIFAIVCQITIYFALLGKANAVPFIQANLPVLNPLPPDIQVEQDQFIRWMKISNYIFILILSIGVQLFYDIFFYFFNKNQDNLNMKLYTICTVSHLLDLFLFFIFFYSCVRNHIAFSLDNSQPLFISHLHQIQYLQVSLAIAMFILWARVIWSIRLTRSLGPFLKSLTKILPDFLLFVVLYGLLIVMFACIANLLLLSNDKFSTIIQSCLTLFQASLGNFDFEIDDRLEYKIFMVFFLIFNMILFFNLIIAVFSNSYSRYEQNQIGFYLKEIVDIYKTYGSGTEQKYGNLLIKIPPFQYLTFIPFLFQMICKQKLFRDIAYHINYLPTIIILIVMLLIVGAILIPVTYIKVLIHKFYLIKISVIQNDPAKRRKKRCYKIIEFLFFLIFGLLLLTLRTIIDITKTVISCYSSQHVWTKYHYIKRDYVKSIPSQEQYRQVTKILGKFNELHFDFEDQDLLKKVQLKELSVFIREHLNYCKGFLEMIQNLLKIAGDSRKKMQQQQNQQQQKQKQQKIFQQQDESLPRIQSSQLQQGNKAQVYYKQLLNEQFFNGMSIKVFDFLKQFLNRNSFTQYFKDSQQQFIYPRLLQIILKENEFQNSMRMKHKRSMSEGKYLRFISKLPKMKNRQADMKLSRISSNQFGYFSPQILPIRNQKAMTAFKQINFCENMIFISSGQSLEVTQKLDDTERLEQMRRILVLKDNPFNKAKKNYQQVCSLDAKNFTERMNTIQARRTLISDPKDSKFSKSMKSFKYSKAQLSTLNINEQQQEED